MILAVVFRLIAISLGLVVSVIAAALFFGLALATGLFPELLEGAGEQGQTLFAAIVVVIGLVAGFNIAGLSAMPVMLAVTATEIAGWRGLTVQLVLGGLCGLFVLFSALPTGAVPSQGTLLVALSCGFVAAFFYWLLAGRNAGTWMAKLPPLGKQDADREN